jgi:hypothetical protein
LETFAKARHDGDEYPSAYCQWWPRPDGGAIGWDGHEKFYSYIEWLCFLVAVYFEPWGYVLEGEMEWVGEDPDDRGMIVVAANVVSTRSARTEYDAAVIVHDPTWEKEVEGS